MLPSARLATRSPTYSRRDSRTFLSLFPCLPLPTLSAPEAREKQFFLLHKVETERYAETSWERGGRTADANDVEREEREKEGKERKVHRDKQVSKHATRTAPFKSLYLYTQCPPSAAYHSKSASTCCAQVNFSRRVLEKTLATGTSFSLHQAMEIRGLGGKCRSQYSGPEI